jgi:hypothetical protein
MNNKDLRGLERDAEWTAKCERSCTSWDLASAPPKVDQQGLIIHGKEVIQGTRNQPEKETEREREPNREKSRL